MPAGIPVATVAIGGGLNAGLLAAQIIGSYDPIIQKKIKDYKQKLHDEVREKDSKLNELGSTIYLKHMKKSL